MRLIPSFLAALVALTALAACGTKTPLSLPPQPQTAAKAAVPPAPSHEGIPLRITPAADNSNKAVAEPRQ
ncbi:MAG: lipoprotein [Sulfuritalea sp.]|jgi:predicted small lipoprotein YifL|nr:lipoprotein [Sulfuritalea hydrogenivorans]MDK9715312.1 lipoprotein [Sulfuritalea sp.]